MIGRARPVWPVQGLALLLLGLAWEGAAWRMGPTWLPGPAAVGARLWEGLRSGALPLDLLATAQLTLAGTLAGAAIGVAAACALRAWPRVDRMAQPLISALMSVPKLGLVPLLVLWFGTGWAPKLALVALTALFIVFAIVYSGLVAIDHRLVTTARVMGASQAQLTRAVVLPSLWPFVLTGLEVALPWAVSAALVAEYLSSQVGIGHALEQARQMSDSTGVFGGIAAATLLVLAGNGLLAMLRHHTVKGPQQDHSR